MDQTENSLENRKFIDIHVKPIFERLMVDILVKKPSNVVNVLFFSYLIIITRLNL